MEALAAAAAVESEPSAEGSPAAGLAGLAAEGCAAGEWRFPVFEGHRRRLHPGDELFEAGNIEREELARQEAVSAARDERRQLSKEAELAGTADVAGRLAVAFECGQCHASLPTARLLELHVAELHDSFFAAQAARRMPVYQCLVEGCHRKFCTVEERKQHLTDHHKFPRNYHFDRIHLRRRKGQIRPLPRYQKGGHGRQAMEGGAAEAATEAEPGGTGAAGAAKEQLQASAAASGAAGGSAGPAAPGEDLAAGMSRLTMAAEQSGVPSVIHFGRGRGRGLTGVSYGSGGHTGGARGAGAGRGRS